ncbi:LysR family transcriptional regulator (plasmid) [Pantoea sp. C3]|uniref:LysR family transcriptional regulator n=1 Tax=Pantoea phytostimulans TaxID=2769024 RepID=UPI0038F7B09E
MNTRFLETFICVVRLGSFRAAADKLHLTQAAISNRIGSLEEDIGTQLFIRDSSILRLTPTGARLVDYSERMLEIHREIMQLGQTNQQMLGIVRIGVIDSIVHTWLVEFLHHLQNSYPGIEIQLSSEATERLHRSLCNGDVDIAFQTDQLIGEGMTSLPCLPMAMGWVCSASNTTFADNVLIDLLRQPAITMSKGSHPHLALKDLYRRASIPIGKIHCVNSIATIVRLVKNGFGQAFLPLAPVREQIEAGELRYINCELDLPQQGFVISYLESNASDAIRFVASLAVEHANKFMANSPRPYSPS